MKIKRNLMTSFMWDGKMKVITVILNVIGLGLSVVR